MYHFRLQRILYLLPAGHTSDVMLSLGFEEGEPTAKRPSLEALLLENFVIYFNTSRDVFFLKTFGKVTSREEVKSTYVSQ